MGDVEDTVGDAEDSVGDIEDIVGDVEDTVGDVEDTVGDVEDTVRDVCADCVSPVPCGVLEPGPVALGTSISMVPRAACTDATHT